MSQELKHELTQCQVALADCRMEKEEVVKELTRLHERFALCSTAEYAHDCEVKILALNEQLETLSGLLAHEREARLFENKFPRSRHRGGKSAGKRLPAPDRTIERARR